MKKERGRRTDGSFDCGYENKSFCKISDEYCAYGRSAGGNSAAGNRDQGSGTGTVRLCGYIIEDTVQPNAENNWLHICKRFMNCMVRR